MSDLETRLIEVLHAEAEQAPSAIGLASAARSRSRARRRRTAVAAGAVAVAVLAVPLAVVVLGGDSDKGDPPTVDAVDPVEVAPGTRTESWHGVTLQVPDDWEYGDQSAWCAGGGSVTTFRVTRPGGVSESIACTPTSSHGLSFQEIDPSEPFEWPVVTQTGDAWPPHTFVGAKGMEGVLVTVAGPDREDLLEVLATVRPISDGVDPNGCSVDDDGGPGMAEAGVVPVCRYDEQGRLVQSEKLTGDQAEAAIGAVRTAKQDDSGRLCRNDPTEYVVMGVEGDRVVVQYAGGSLCGDRGVFVEGLRHELTSDILYWALSPGWTGSVDEYVTLPDPLRQ